MATGKEEERKIMVPGKKRKKKKEKEMFWEKRETSGLKSSLSPKKSTKN